MYLEPTSAMEPEIPFYEKVDIYASDTRDQLKPDKKEEAHPKFHVV